MTLDVEKFYDPETYTLTYIVYDSRSLDAIVIDPVLNYDYASSTVKKDSIREIERFIKEKHLNLHFILETHAHADHITGAFELKKIFPKAKTGINENIKLVQKTFRTVFNLEDLKIKGEQFDYLLKDNEELKAGSIDISVISTPGHTPACSSFLVSDIVFTGDTLFMPDYGTGRCDFPLGSAKELYHSIHEKLYKLPDETSFYTGHDYQPNGRELKYKSTIGESKESNIQLRQDTSLESFVEFRESRDKTLSAPKLLLPSIQININGGELPLRENNGKAYIKIPLNTEE